MSHRELFAGRWEQITTITDAVHQVGLHVVIYGERGVGKTSLANIIRPLVHIFDNRGVPDGEETDRLVVKVNSHHDDDFSSIWIRAFDEVRWVDEQPLFGFGQGSAAESVSLREAFSLGDDISIDQVRRSVTRLPGSVFAFDEFDRCSGSVSSSFTDLIKALSDFSVDSTIILVGVSDTVDELIKDHASIARAIVQVRMPRMRENELRDILNKGEEKLDIEFAEPAAARIVRTSQGLPHYTHLLGLYSVRQACKALRGTVVAEDVQASFELATKEAQQSIKTKFSTATHSSHQGALYNDVLLACAMTAASVVGEGNMGYFQAAAIVEPLQRILPDKNVGISQFNKHLNEFCNEKRGCVLERTGPPRGYRYRFRDPLLPPYIIMRAMADKSIPDFHFNETD